MGAETASGALLALVVIIVLGATRVVDGGFPGAAVTVIVIIGA